MTYSASIIKANSLAQKNIHSKQQTPAFPVKLLATSTVLTITAMIWIGGNSFYIQKFLNNGMQQNQWASDLVDNIMHEDAVLTEAAKMSASTGNPKWEKIYNEHVNVLDNYIKTALENFPNKEIQDSAHSTDEANQRLIELETSSFNFVHKNNLSEASKILEGDEYKKYKQIYAAGMRDFTRKVLVASNKPLIKLADNAYYTLYLIIAIISVLSITWYFAIRSVRRWRIELETAQALAQKAVAVKSDFLANMSHELRTPMTGVLGMGQLLAETELSVEQQQYVSTINESGEALLTLLNDILDFSKIEAGALTLEHIAYNVKDAITGSTNLLRPQADKKKIDLQVEFDPDIPDYIWGDSGRIRQVIINLVGNAIKFTSKGYVCLTAQMQKLGNESRLHISVEDTGIGIPANKLEEIFDKFTQADTSVTRKFGGTGLGLAITRQLVELMGGNIGVESAEGKGSIFWFMIPCIPASKEDAEQVNDHNIHLVASENLRPIAEARILLVEDYQVNQVFAEKLLKKFGVCHIDIAENGVEALKKYRTGNYDMIFMDCHMPEIDGYQATMQLRQMEKGTPQHTTIIAMTANAMMGDREKCLKAGMDDYLSKPLRARHLKKILEARFVLDADKAIITKIPIATPKEAADIPVDMEQLRLFTNDDPEEEKALIALFLEQAKAMISILQKSTGADDHEAWRSAAHRLKGSSGNLGAMKLHSICKHAETNCKDIEPKKNEMLAAIKEEALRVEQFLPI